MFPDNSPGGSNIKRFGKYQLIQYNIKFVSNFLILTVQNYNQEYWELLLGRRLLLGIIYYFSEDSAFNMHLCNNYHLAH